MRDEVYELANSDIKDLYYSQDSGDYMKFVFDKYRSSNTDYITYATLIGDTILGFYKTSDLPRLFQSELGLGADDAQRLTADLLEFLSPVLKREEEELNEQKAPINNLVAAIEAEHENREPVTTTESMPRSQTAAVPEQADRVHGYGAYRSQYRYGEEPEKVEGVVRAVDQSDLLKKPDLVTAHTTTHLPDQTPDTEESEVRKVEIRKIPPVG